MCDLIKLRRSSVHPEPTKAGSSRATRGKKRHRQDEAIGELPRLEECIQSVREFCGVCARYNDMLLVLGSNQDSAKLREDLRRIRRKACDLAKQNQTTLLPQLRSSTVGPEREHFEKMWNVFSACLETLHAHLCKTVTLTQTFPVHSYSCVVIRTGLSDPGHGVTSRGAAMASTSNGHSKDTSRDLQMLKRDSNDIAKILLDTQDKVDVKPWTFEADPDTTKFYSESLVDSDVESLDSDVTSLNIHWTQRRKKCICLFVGVLTSVIVFGTVLGVCVALFT